MHIAEGIHHIPVAKYDGIDADNFSTLKHMEFSPLAYRHAKSQRTEETTAMRLGTAVHCAVLEPERFSRQYAVYPGAVRRGKDWEAWQADHPGMITLTQKQMTMAIAMSLSVRKHPVAARFLRQGRAEVTMVWKDPASGRMFRGRVDWLDESRDLVLGLKTAGSLDERMFATRAARLGYHVQWAMYAAGYRALRKKEPSMVELVVEAKPPHDVVPYTIPGDVMLDGELVLRKWVDAVVECEANGTWPGRAPDGRVFALPNWYTGGIGEAEIDFTGLEDA